MAGLQEQLSTYITEQTMNSVTRSETAMQSSIVISIIAVILAIILSWLTQNYIRKPIIKVANYLDQMAGRDLAMSPLSYNSQDEIGQLTKSMNHLRSSIQSIFTTVYQHSEESALTTNLLSNQMGETVKGIEDVSTSITEIAAQSQSQLKGIEESSNFCKGRSHGRRSKAAC